MKNYYSIGTISKICNISTKTLRYYDKIGILVPEFRDADTGYRYYSKKQLTAILIIRRLRNYGFSIQEIKETISDPSLDNIKNILSKKIEEYDLNINILEAQKSLCSVAINRIKNGEKIFNLFKSDELNEENEIHEIKIEKIKNANLYFSRKIMKQYVNSEVSLSRWIDIYEKCTENGISMTSSIIVTYFTRPLDQFLLKDCDVEFGVLVDSNDICKINIDNLRAWGDFEACTSYYIGKYENIMKRHIEMLKWININGYEVDGPVSEEFIISPLDVYNEDEHVTKIIIPVKKTRR